VRNRGDWREAIWAGLPEGMSAQLAVSFRLRAETVMPATNGNMTISRTDPFMVNIRRKLLSQVMPLNMNDPFEAHAVFALLFVCERCGRNLQFESELEIGSEGYSKELANEARLQNWFCPAAEPDGKMHVMFCLCPDCAPFKEEELAKTKWHKLS